MMWCSASRVEDRGTSTRRQILGSSSRSSMRPRATGSIIGDIPAAPDAVGPPCNVPPSCPPMPPSCFEAFQHGLVEPRLHLRLRVSQGYRLSACPGNATHGFRGRFGRQDAFARRPAGPYDLPVHTLCRDCGCLPPADAGTCPACGSTRVLRHPELHDLAIAHLDCDAFYAAIEKRDRPELADDPVIVGGRHRGVVAACCYVARTYGVRSAMPTYRALRLCPEATVVRPDMKKYAAVGREVRAMMLDLTPLVEPLSIDEAFMDLSGTRSLHRASPAATLAALARRVEQEISISVSIGLSYNKFLAKIASDLDKPRGFAVIGRAEARPFLAGKPVGLLWGVGDVLRNRLARDGIATIGQLARLDEAELVARYGKIGRRLFQCAHGEDDRPVDPDREAKSMSSEITLGEDLSDAARLRPILWQLAETVARRMKKAGVAGSGVTLKLKTADFRILTRARRLNTPTQSAEEMFRAVELLLAREADGRAFRLIGIGAHDLVEARSVVQGDLFGGVGREDDRIDKAVDALRDRFGEDAIVRGRGFGTRLVRQGPSKDN